MSCNAYKYIVLSTLVLCLGTTVTAQELTKVDPATGLPKGQFEEMFGKAITKAKEKRISPIDDPTHLQQNIVETRLFLTGKEKVLRAEVVVKGKTSIKQLQLSLEKGETLFQDMGRGADLKAGDGIFSAFINMDITKSLRAREKALQLSLSAIKSVSGNRRGRIKGNLIVGDRSIISGKDATRVVRQEIKRLDGFQIKRGQKVLAALRAKTAGEFARTLGLDIKKVPVLTFPGPKSIRSFFHEFIVGIPILPFFPGGQVVFPGGVVVPVDQAASLMVTNLGSVEDPTRTFDACTNTGTKGGAWSFGHLIREMSKGSAMNPQDFTLHWLSNWIVAQAVNGWVFNEPGRAAELETQIINTWDGMDGTVDGNFDVDLFPARLMAIVNRPDLADKIGYSSAGSAGEGRFVFGLLGQGCNTIPFTVIFEYGIKGGSCPAVKSWHQRWKNLDGHPIGSASYNVALEDITRDFTDFGGQSDGESALNQLRTNEIALGTPWQLLEFKINASGNLAMDTVKQTPDLSLNNGLTLQAYLQAFESEILANKHVVRERFPTMLNPFLAVKSDTPFQFLWETPNPSGLTNHDETRHLFSLNTCNGCHAGETDTLFTHIGDRGRRNMGSPAELSDFLTGNNMPKTIDPSPAPIITRSFNDLAIRELKMGQILGKQCLSLLPFRRISAPH